MPALAFLARCPTGGRARGWSLVSVWIACLALVLAGCGNQRTPVPRLGDVAPSGGFDFLPLSPWPIAINVARRWSWAEHGAPLLLTESSGPAILAVWRFARHSSVPRSDSELRAARDALVAQARRRDPFLQLIRTRIGSLQGLPTIELDAGERVGGAPRRVRSLHVFAENAEVIIDAYAPPALFHDADHAVFSPVKHSLRLLRAPSA